MIEIGANTGGCEMGASGRSGSIGLEGNKEDCITGIEAEADPESAPDVDGRVGGRGRLEASPASLSYCWPTRLPLLAQIKVKHAPIILPRAIY